MLRRTVPSYVRLPMIRRPRERTWEIMNQKDYGVMEGGQNLKAAGLVFLVFSGLIAFESYRMWCRVLLRGDTCPACDEARRQYRMKQIAKERELAELDRLKKDKSAAVA